MLLVKEFVLSLKGKKNITLVFLLSNCRQVLTLLTIMFDGFVI